MDDDDGETHPELGAKIMSVFGDKWSDLVLLHSRFYAKRLGRPISRLCVADKLAICMYPCWLWKLLVLASGEWRDYMETPKYAVVDGYFGTDSLDEKCTAMTTYLRGWIEENR